MNLCMYKYSDNDYFFDCMCIYSDIVYYKMFIKDYDNYIIIQYDSIHRLVVTFNEHSLTNVLVS